MDLKRRYASFGGGRNPNDLGFIGHQANLRMLEAVARRCEIAKERHFFNVDVRGNCGASGAPTVLSENWDNKGLGDAVAMAVVGAGLTWSGALFERER
jgi:3-oxoacyl-[acyl-carrier-protein] synthase-3